MKYASFYPVAIILLLFGCNNQYKTAAANKSLQSLLNQKDYFKLNTQLNAYGNLIDDEKKLYFKSFIDNAFNLNAECIDDVNKLLETYAGQLPDSTKCDVGRLQIDSYFKLFQYKKAAENDSLLLKRYTHILHKNDIDDIKNDMLIRGALRNTPPQQTIIKNDELIEWKKDKLGLIEIPVKTNAATYDGIFDTRANISSITQTYAKKLGLHILNVTYNEGSGATGIEFKSGLGIADSLYIGNILVKHVVFQVMPDSILYIAPIKTQLTIIIGFPVIAQLQEIHIYTDGKMTIPLTPAKSGLHNFALDGLNPVIALKSGKDILPFYFDLGADQSVFYVAYFQKYKSSILKNAIQKTVGFGGAGGMQKKKVYILPSLNLSIGNKTVRIDSANILTQKIVPDETYYGNIGQDFVNKFSEITFNFKYMYINVN